jgi:phage terminase large subunit
MTAPTVTTHRYRPRGTAQKLMECRAPEVLLSGPAGTGKSRACLEKLHLMALLNPGLRGLIIRKTHVSLGSTALVTFREHVAKESLAAGHVRWYGGSQSEAACFRYTNGSVINVGGMDKATRIMSSEYDVVYVQEAIELTVTDWESITTRLRNGRVSFQQLMADTNPDTGTHWLKQRADSGRTLMLECRHEDNPTIVEDDGSYTVTGAAYMAKLDALTGVRHARLRKGLWVAAEGQIFDGWDPAVHLIDPFRIPAEWTRWWAVDFGFTNPFVLQRWAQDPDGRLFLYAETYLTKRLVEDHAADVLALVTKAGRKEDGNAGHRVWIEPKPRAIITDHDAEGRATFEEKIGLPTVAANKKVKDGIQAVQSRLKNAGDKKPRLFILRDAITRRDPDLVSRALPTCTADEVGGYVWNAAKDEPVKENDHGCDAMRYLVMHVDKGQSKYLRWVA